MDLIFTVDHAATDGFGSASFLKEWMFIANGKQPMRLSLEMLGFAPETIKVAEQYVEIPFVILAKRNFDTRINLLKKRLKVCDNPTLRG